MKYLKVTVTREQSTDAYVQVPDDFDKATLGKFRDELNRIVDETTCSYDWETESRVSLDYSEEVAASEAEQYAIGTLDTSKPDTRS